MVGPGLIIVIPAYREATTVGAIVAGAISYAPVIVVDDASCDETGDRAAAAGAEVVSSPTNLGYEGALNAGFEAAAACGAKSVLTMDADGEHGVENILSFMRLLVDEDVPLVLGYRSRTQRPAEALIGGYIRARFGVSDIFCGMKGYHTNLWRRHGCFDRRKAVGTELALAAVRGGVPFRQIPVGGRPRSDHPRFDRQLHANFRIVRAIGRSLAAPAIRWSE